MKICSVCLKNDFLCNACNKRIASGHVSKTDVEMSRALFKLGIDADFIRSLDAGDYYVVVADKKGSGVLIGKGGRNSRRLTTVLGKNLRVIENVSDEKNLIEKIVGAPVIGINKVYGTKELYKVRVETRFRNRVESLSPLVSKIMDKNVKFVFE